MKVFETELQIDYAKRINAVFSYIDQNLDADLSLEVVSKIACFSPFHFHRIFKTIVGETLNAYVTRRRVEKAAAILIHDKATSITELSLRNGFNNNTSFTRTFKKFYGISPTDFRNQNSNRFSKIRQLESKNGQDLQNYEKYICVITNLKKWIKMNAKIEIKEMPRLNLAYISNIGDENLGQTFEKLLKWATPKGLLNDPTAKIATIYHDSFKITDPGKMRMSACITLNKSVEVDGEVGLTSIEKGKFIVGRFEINLSDFEKSWTGLFIWMNENGYKKSDQNPFEIYQNNFNEHPEKKAVVDFYIPIEY